jgi:carbamate kinase
MPCSARGATGRDRTASNVAAAVRTLAAMATRRQVVITHGNSHQEGLLALEGETYPGVRLYPLDVLGAESEGMIGYLIEEDLRNAVPGREVAALLTQVADAASLLSGDAGTRIEEV